MTRLFVASEWMRSPLAVSKSATFQFPSWVGDNVQLGSDRPYLKSILIFSEQLIRVVLAVLLVERFQINALIIAYFVGGLFNAG